VTEGAWTIGLIEDQVVTESLVREPAVERGLAVSDPASDLAKIAVVERIATGRTASRLRFRAAEAARAHRASHDAHNLVSSDVGSRHGLRDRAARRAGRRIVVARTRVLAELPLPIAGLLSDAPYADVITQSRACNEAAHGLGWSGATPFLTLSFLGLSVIPHLKISDRGLVDVDRFELVPLAVSGAE
jgi:adenine deaminase